MTINSLLGGYQKTGAMRYPTGDLAILSAESYSDGRVRQLRSAIVKTKKSRTALAIEDAEGAPARKRRKTASPDAAGEEEEKKRSRGRPRLEPKDETAQDVSLLSSAPHTSV